MLTKVWGKIKAFICSMKLGMGLLVLILVLSLIGSFITQDSGADYAARYAGQYGENFALWIERLQLNHIYFSWYYVTLFAMLVVNLIFCSVLRGFRVFRLGKKTIDRARNSTVTAPLDREWLKKKHFRSADGQLYQRQLAGLYGSFITHLGLTVLLLAAGCVLFMQTEEKIPMPIGEAYTLSDGTVLTAKSLTMENEEGQTDYRSDILVKTAEGTEEVKEASVNNPLRLGLYSVYLDSYEWTEITGHPSVGIQIQMTDVPDVLELTDEETLFLSLNGKDGLYYYGMYYSVKTDDDGSAYPVVAAENGYNPAFLVRSVLNGEEKEFLVFPETMVDCGGFYCTFHAPEAPEVYPVICLRTLPTYALPVLYVSFAMLLVGLFLCFCMKPMAVFVDGERMRLAAKPGVSALEILEDEKENL